MAKESADNQLAKAARLNYTTPAPAWWNIRALAAPYAVILQSRLQSQTTYGKVFWFEMLGMVFFITAELCEMLVYFHNVETFGGLTLSAMFVLFGLSSASFALAQVAAGHLDEICTFIREGTLETMYVRPLSLLGQLVTADIQIKRLGRAVFAMPMLLYGLWHSDVSFTLNNFALIVVAILSGTAIFASLFLLAGSIQFFLINAPELANTITYATNYVSQLPISIFPRPMQWVYLLIFPAGFISYLPTLELVGLTHTFWMPPGAAWFAPCAAAGSCLLTGIMWKVGVRHYQSAGG